MSNNESVDYAEKVGQKSAQWRVPSWGTIGMDASQAVTAEEALTLGGLNWTVSKNELTTSVISESGVSNIVVPDKFAVVRNHPELGPKALGVVGNRYHLVQNSEAFSLCNALVDDGDAKFSAAGSLAGGRKVFVAMELPREILVGGQDLVKNYLLVTNTHDGTEPLIASITSIRFACTNQIRAISRNAKFQWRLRHNQTMDGRLEDARQALALSWQYMDEFEEISNELISTPMTRTGFKQFIDFQFPVTVTKTEATNKAVTQNENLKSELMGLWHAQTQANIADTRWAAYNAVVEYFDWMSPVKGKDKDARRAERTIENANHAVTNKALKTLLAV